MNRLIIAFIVLCPYTLTAQEFKKELIGKMLPAKMILGDGSVQQDVLMKYQPPEFFKNAMNEFTISTAAQPDPYKHTGGIQAFMIDNIIWALRPSPTSGTVGNEFVIMTRQGAIEEYKFITSGRGSESNYAGYTTMGTITRKIGGQGVMATQMSDKQLREWLSDSPESVKELRQADSLAAAKKSDSSKVKRKGLMAALEKTVNALPGSSVPGIVGIIENYNADYEMNNPGKIKYYFQSPPRRAYPKGASGGSVKKPEDPFANRNTTVSAEIASAKDNQPVKKETFAAKIQRIKADGNKIGLVVIVKPARVPKQTGSGASMMGTEHFQVEGEYMDESLKAAGQELVQELNQALGITDIELIDIHQIPYREVKVLGTTGKSDDWWATKYKVVFSNIIDPQLRTTHESSGREITFNAALSMVNSLTITEYIGAPASKQQDIIAQVLNLGGFLSPVLSQKEDITDVKEIYQKIVEKLDATPLEKMKAERISGVKKLVEKKLAD